MKSEHRHELKTNELAEWLMNLPQWAKDNTRTLIYIGVVVVAVVGAYIWKIYKTDVVDKSIKSTFTNSLGMVAASKQQVLESQASGQDGSFALVQIGNQLQQVADTTKNTNIAALALIKSAEAIRAELHYRQLLAITPEETITQLEKAKTAYNAGLQKATNNPTLTAMAKYGIGLCEEELGNFDTAKNMYQEIVNDPNLKPTVSAAQAKFRLEFMDEYKEPFQFRPAPPKAQAQPTIELQPAQIDMNQVRLDANAVKPAEANAPAVIESNDANKAPKQ